MSVVLKEIATFGQEPVYYASFLGKTFILFIAAVIMGTIIEVIVKRIQRNALLGYRVAPYIALQLVLSSTVLYLLHKFWAQFAQEFQATLAGIYFVTFFLGVQYTLNSNIQSFVSSMV
jgi:hypothetical protein